MMTTGSLGTVRAMQMAVGQRMPMQVSADFGPARAGGPRAYWLDATRCARAGMAAPPPAAQISISPLSGTAWQNR